MKRIIFILILLVGCKSFKPVQLENDLSEREDFYSVIKFYAEFDKTPDSAFIGIVYGEYQKALQEKRLKERETHCKTLYYKDAVIDKDNYKQYSEYLKCVAGK